MNRETAVLQLFQARGLGQKRLRKLIDALAQGGDSPEEFVGHPREELLDKIGLGRETGESIAQARGEAEQLVRLLSRHNIRVVTFLDPGYPSRLNRTLGPEAPPVLFVYGDVSLLERKSVGFCGSRHPSGKAIDLTQHTAAAVANAGFNVVSGYAGGVDTAAHLAASRAGGITTIVLPEGILHFRMKSELGEFADEGTLLVMSEFPPRLPWAAHNAMQRNSTICGLSDVVVVVEAGSKGGTFEAGRTTLRLGLELFVLDYPGRPSSAAGNSELIRRGGHPIKVKADGSVDLTPLLDCLSRNNGPPSGRDEQGELFGMIG